MIAHPITQSQRLRKYQRMVASLAKRILPINQAFPRAYVNSVRIDICGTCNAKCLFCHSGKVPFDKNRMMAPALFEDIIAHLRDIKLLTKSVYLYDRGEPFMHSRIGEILDICRAHHIHAMISTNASRVPDLSRDQWKTIINLKVSLSGITKSSYERIYGLNLNQARRNIEKISLDAAARCDLKANWLKYTFNAEEEKTARLWLEAMGFRFKPKPARLVQIEKLIELREGRLDHGELEAIRDCMLLEARQNSPLRKILSDDALSKDKNEGRFVCQQWDRIIVHDTGELLKCCDLSPYNPENRLGNILNYSAKEIKEKKYNVNDICDKCIKYGLPVPTKDKYSRVWRKADLH